ILLNNEYLKSSVVKGENPPNNTPDAGRAVAADVVGAAGGAAIGGFGAFFSGAAMSIYDLYQQGAFNKVPEKKEKEENKEGDNKASISENPVNPYDRIGTLHNELIIDYIIGNYNSIIDSS